MYDATRFSIGMNVQRKRQQRGLTLDELAAQSGIPAEDLAILEAGSGDFPISYLFQLAPILHIRASTLVEGEEKSRMRAKSLHQALLIANNEWDEGTEKSALTADKRQNKQQNGGNTDGNDRAE